MDFIFYLFVFLFGLIVGSFLNVVICRLGTGETIVSGRSHCPRCGYILAWYDLIPVLSFLTLRGRCRYCGKPISIQYPLVETGTGILFLIIFNFSAFGGSAAGGQFSPPAGGFNEFSISNFQFLNPAFNFNFFYFLPSTFYLLFIISSLIVIFVYDLKHYIIPDKIIYPAIGVSLVYLIAQFMEVGLPYFGSPTSGILVNFIFAAAAVGAFFLIIVILTQGKGMGGGDAKLAFLMGLILGWPKVLAALFLAFTAGAIYGIILILMRKKTLKGKVPFGPFLAAGTVVAMLWGEEIMRLYSGYLL